MLLILIARLEKPILNIQKHNTSTDFRIHDFYNRYCKTDIIDNVIVICV